MANAYDASSYGAMQQARAQQEQFGSDPTFANQYSAGVNEKKVETAIKEIVKATELITVGQIEDIQTNVIDTLKKGWLTPDGKEHIELYTNTLNELTANIVRKVTSICTELKETGEEYAKKAFNVSVTINMEAPTRKLVNSAGAKERGDDGTIYVMTPYLENAKDHLLQTVMPDLENIVELIKRAASSTGLYDKDAALQNYVNNTISELAAKITEDVAGIVGKINASINWQSAEALEAKAMGEAKFAAMHGADWS